MSRRGVLGLAAGAGALGLLPASRPVSARTTPNVRTIFSYPTLDGEGDQRHEESFVRLVRRAAPDAELHLSIYLFTRDTIANALVEAAERGVDVNVLVDERSEYSSATGILRDRLDDDALGVVSNAGIGDRINHNKFLVISALETGDNDVVWQSSSNFTDNQVSYHNSTVVIRNDAPLYEAYRSYWEDLADDGFQDLSYNRTEETDTATVYFSPRDDFDTHVRALEDVTPSWNTKIYFLQSIWTESREAESGLIAGPLTELIDNGADVRVVLQERNNAIPDLLAEAGAEVVVYPDAAQTQVHSKNVLVDALFETDDGDTERRREVWTGTQNLSRPGLRRNDETLLRIVDDYVYNDFLDDWERVYRQAKRARSRLDGADEGTATPARTATPTPANTLEPDSTTSTDTPQRKTATTTEGEGPGFGMVAALGALAGTGYAAYRRAFEE